MRKTAVAMLIVSMTVMLLLTLIACKKDCGTLGHDWGEPLVGVDATCATEGKYIIKCNRCGEVKDGDVIPPTDNHIWVAGAVTESPTCTQMGKQTYTCSVCHREESIHIGKSAHSYGQLHSVVEATCITDGNVAYYQCSICNQYFNKDKEPIDTVVIPATGQHSFGELHGRVEPKCNATGTLAYKQCTVCHDYFDELDEYLGNSEDCLVIAATGVHTWDLTEVSWLWAETYQDFVENGVKLQLTCSVCGAKDLRETTAVKDDEASVEPTYTRQGMYVFTAELTVNGKTLTDRKTYTDVPVLPDGKPDNEYALVLSSDGSNWDGELKLMTWNVEEQVLQIEQSFSASQLWRITENATWGAENAFFDEIIVTNLVESIALDTDFFTYDANTFEMSYDCTLAIKLDLSMHKIYLHILELDTEVREKECYFAGGINGWVSDDSDYKFAMQEDGTFTFTAMLDYNITEGLVFQLVYGGVAMGYNDVNRDIRSADGDLLLTFVTGPNKDGHKFMATAPCKILLTYDPTTNTLVIEVLEVFEI